MQREETAVAIGSHRIRLLQRPPQVPPSTQPAAHASPAGAGPLSHPAPHLTDRPHCATQEPYPRLPPDDSSDLSDGSLTPKQPPAASASGGAALQPSDCLLGWELWPAAWRLAAFLVSPPGVRILRAAAAVVELGAGLGLPGILAAKAGARRVTLTDLPQALPLLAANVELNGVAAVCRTAVLDWVQLAAAAARDAASAAAAARPSSSGGGSSSTAASGQRPRQEQQELGCGGSGLEEGAGPPHVGAYDVVLAADVVYVSSLAPLLADAIAAVCRRDGGGADGAGGGGGGGAVVLVGHTVRKSVWLDRATGLVRTDETDEPWEAFVDRMTRRHGFSCSRLAEVVAASGDGAADAAVPPDTFVCSFTRSSSSSSSSSSGVAPS